MRGPSSRVRYSIVLTNYSPLPLPKAMAMWSKVVKRIRVMSVMESFRAGASLMPAHLVCNRITRTDPVEPWSERIRDYSPSQRRKNPHASRWAIRPPSVLYFQKEPRGVTSSGYRQWSADQAEPEPGKATDLAIDRRLSGSKSVGPGNGYARFRPRSTGKVSAADAFTL
jgi:hypothetical protein